MSYVLVVSKDANFRKFCVDNLVIRGYLAVGVTSVKEGENLLKRTSPSLVILYSTAAFFKSEVYSLRNNYGLVSTPILLIDEKSIDTGWMNRWNVSAQAKFSMDARGLVDALTPWLQKQHTTFAQS